MLVRSNKKNYFIDLCFSDDDTICESDLIVLLNEFFSSCITQSEQSSRIFVQSIVVWELENAPRFTTFSSILKAINSLNKNINLSCCILLEATIQQYFKTIDSEEALNLPSWYGIMERSALFPLTNIDIIGFIQNNLFLCLHLYCILRIKGMSDFGEQLLFLQMVNMELLKIKPSEKMEAKWFVLIGLIVQFSLKQPANCKQFLLSLARQLIQTSSQADSWSDGLLGAIGFKKVSMSNSKRILCRCLASLIFSSFDESEVNYQIIESEYNTSIRELNAMIHTKKFSEMRTPTLQIISALEKNEVENEDFRANTAKVIRLFYKDHFLETLEDVWR